MRVHPDAVMTGTVDDVQGGSGTWYKVDTAPMAMMTPEQISSKVLDIIKETDNIQALIIEGHSIRLLVSG